ncbi:unnamed protein product [Rotaria magnacalcarata]|uniref:Endonuclease/exonuclease/phosphatase domain-containing protein n=1 Tax=Rotaria magnacalcarata TaxID=392030 RepID=A0A814G0S5_9BILA|nr:unnamed protein product [Rotaria magnacalcarata]CAF1249976.1 unnamed protein product [Rotaria magnacalcarata]CAF1900908.1 unnamed protein product [Rotaria magnacalcarata]CAF3799786.1 unnamed protein product [Rotaria magnacalcarata]CAF3826903.1 unnamed protein product [Rotaria magnacalcarata]
MSTFRLATLNVHSFRTRSTYANNVSDLVSILKPLNLDLIALEEITNDTDWRRLCRDLSLPHLIYGDCERHHFGVGIASRYPIISSSNQETTASYQGGHRSLLRCVLNGDHRFLTDRIFAVTHLDYLDENDRLHQIKEFNPPEQNIDILMGDMNALTREDYSDDYYQHRVVDVRKQAAWESPRFELTNLIKNEWNYIDAFRLINPTLKNEKVTTCYYGTRIDYIYFRPKINDLWMLSKCWIIDTKGATDHNAVVAEFKEK